MFGTRFVKYKGLIVLALVVVAAFLAGAGVGSFKKYLAKPAEGAKPSPSLSAETGEKPLPPSVPGDKTDGNESQIPSELGVPSLPGLQMSSCQSLKGGFVIQGTTLRPPADVILYYHNRVADHGWTNVNIVSEKGAHSLTCNKEKNSLSVKAVEDSRGTMVTVRVEQPS